MIPPRRGGKMSTTERWEPLYDIAAGEASRDAGMALALSAEINSERIFKAVYSCALLFHEFTSDAVWLMLGGPLALVEHPNAIGASFNRAAIQNIIQATGRVKKSQRPAAHRRNLQVWKSLVWTGESE